MGVIKRLWRWFFPPDSPPPERYEPIPPPPPRELVYLPLRQAAERAAGQFYKTLFYATAVRDGLDVADPVINWFGNLIASHAPVALLQEGEWNDYPPDQQDFNIVEGGARAMKLGAFGTRFEVAIRSDFLQDFLDMIHRTVRSDPKFYANGPPFPHDRVRLVMGKDIREPNRVNEFSYERFDEEHRRDAGLKLLDEANRRMMEVQALLRDKSSPPPKQPKVKQPKKPGGKRGKTS